MPEPISLENSDLPLVEMRLPRERWSGLNSLLRQGFYVRVPGGLSLQQVLNQEFGISREYLQDRVQTIFLDSSPVDELEKAYPRAWSVVALSSAMPGLVGATMRKGGYYAALRGDISYQGQAAAKGQQELPLQIKLFNFLAPELAENFLSRVIILDNSPLLEFVQLQGSSFWAAPANILLQGREVDRAELEDNLQKHGQTGLQVKCPD
ncbi:MAG: hypothetical protein R6U22_09450 [Desulfohalobiaceae bacterium]